MFRKLLEIFRPAKRRRRLLTEQTLRYRGYLDRLQDLIEWNELALKWGLGLNQDVQNAIQTVDNCLKDTERWLLEKKVKKSKLCLNRIAKELNSKVLRAAVNEQLTRYRTRLSRLLLAAKDAATEVCQDSHQQSIRTLLTSCVKLCRQANRDQSLGEVVKTSNKSIELLERLVNEIQSSSNPPAATQNSVSEALARIRQQLREQPHRDPYCKAVLMKELAMIFNLNKKQTHEDFRLAILCEASALKKHFSALMGDQLASGHSPIFHQVSSSTDSAVLWRLSITRGLLFYIVGMTPDHFQVKREWYRLIRDFSATIVFLEDFSAPTDKEAEGILSALMLFQQERILLAGPDSLEPQETNNNKHFFLLDFLHNIKLLSNPKKTAHG